MQIERLGEVALLRMQAGKANAINTGFLDAMRALLDQLEASPPSALVITGDARAFCAGLDLPSLIELDLPAMAAFIDRFNSTMLRIFTLPWPVVAAINGHAIAGGCVLALQADARVMAAGPGRIGLNEVQIGIGLPAVVMETLRCQVPAPSLRPIAQYGELFSPDDAARLGLVDEVVPPEQLLERALERARNLGALPGAAFRQVKHSLRRPAVEAVHAADATDTKAWVGTFFSEQARRLLREVVERLRKK